MTPIKITLPERGYYLSAQIGARFCIIEPHRTLDHAFYIAAHMPSGDLWKTPQPIDASEVPGALEKLWAEGFGFERAEWQLKATTTSPIGQA